MEAADPSVLSFTRPLHSSSSSIGSAIMAASKRASWLPPAFVLSLVVFLYGVYLLLVLLPQLRRLRFLQPEPTPPPRVLATDPHMHPAQPGEVVALALALHAMLGLFLASFFQALATPPGSVPRGDPRWERGEFGIELEEDREVERIIRDTKADLTQVNDEIGSNIQRRREDEASSSFLHASARGFKSLTLPCSCSPLSVQPHVRALLRRMPVVERKKGPARSSDEESPLTADPDDLKRKCHACMVYKPDRVHHCSVCGCCVLRMDHRT